MNSFIDAGYHWIETTPAPGADVRTFQRGLPAPVTQVEAGRVHALAAHFDKLSATERVSPERAVVWSHAAEDVRKLLRATDDQ